MHVDENIHEGIWAEVTSLRNTEPESKVVWYVFIAGSTAASHYTVLREGPTMIMGRLMFENQVEPVK